MEIFFGYGLYEINGIIRGLVRAGLYLDRSSVFGGLYLNFGIAKALEYSMLQANVTGGSGCEPEYIFATPEESIYYNH